MRCSVGDLGMVIPECRIVGGEEEQSECFNRQAARRRSVCLDKDGMPLEELLDDEARLDSGCVGNGFQI